MSEATRLEESVHKSKRERFDLAQVCRDLGAAYRKVYSHCLFNLEIGVDSLLIEGVPDLLAQLLDKLVDNAASFTPAGGTISIRLSSSGLLEVINEGPPLPAAMQGQLFDSLVSVRERGDHMHLGLGLHIVKLIADFHEMEVAAENLEDGSGVRVSVQAHPCAPE